MRLAGDRATILLMAETTTYAVAGVRPPTRCPSCKTPVSVPSVAVTRLHATKTGFEVHGTGELSCFCPTCGQFVEAIKQAFTVDCVGAKCPNCEGTDIACVLSSVSRSAKRYEFEGKIVCAQCGHVGLWRKFVSVLAKISRLKLAVGPTQGVEVEIERG